MTPKNVLLFVYWCQKYAEFYADSKSVKIIGKKGTQKNLFAKNLCKLPSH
jgi:hypothetical protein